MKSFLKQIAVVVIFGGVLLGQETHAPIKSDADVWQELARQKRTVLKGLNAVLVAATYRLDLTSENLRLKTAVELRLQKCGVRLWENPEEPPGQPILLCNYVFVPMGSTNISKFTVSLWEDASLVRNSRQIKHESWSSQNLHDRESKAPLTFEEARDLILEGVDEFCNDFMAANRKDDEKDKPMNP